MAALANPFAAVPSIHTCYSLIIGVTCFFLVRHRALGFTWLFYPVLIVFSIVATGNHFWTDAFLGGVLACVALGSAWLIERCAPHPAALGPRADAARGADAARDTGHRKIASVV